MKKTLDFIMNGADVKRYHTVVTITPETVGHHSHGVASLCLLFEPNASASLLKAALFHDLPEQHTGDIPSPAKHELGIAVAIYHIEDQLMLDAGIEPVILTDTEHRILKFADWAHGALFCTKEIALGNKKMRKVFDRYITYIEGYRPEGREREIIELIKEYAE